MGIQQGLCGYGAGVFAAWKGEVGDDRLFYSQFNGTKWTPQATIGGNPFESFPSSYHSGGTLSGACLTRPA
jgi:hypothetical protein